MSTDIFPEYPRTESSHSRSMGIDEKSALEVLNLLLEGQVESASVISEALPYIDRASIAAAEAISAGCRLAYVGAGSSGLMAMCDALELPGTFGIAKESIVLLIAGGMQGLSEFTGGPEDDEALARTDIAKSKLSAGDCAICVTASGTTPYTVEAINVLKSLGVTTIGLANNAQSPALLECDIPILIGTPAEVIAGSTRMGAGTAQKITLNMISSYMAVRLGYVYDGYMVNFRPDNIKLKKRAFEIISKVTGCAHAQAVEFLERAKGDVRVAILIASGVDGVDLARALLTKNQGHLRRALRKLN